MTSQYADAMERLKGSEYNHANQTNALRVAVEDLHNASAVILLLWHGDCC